MRESIALADGCKVGRRDARGSVIPRGSSFKQPRRLLAFLFQIRFKRRLETHHTRFRTCVCCDASIYLDCSISIEDRSCSNRGIVYRFSQCHSREWNGEAWKSEAATRLKDNDDDDKNNDRLEEWDLPRRFFCVNED